MFRVGRRFGARRLELLKRRLEPLAFRLARAQRLARLSACRRLALCHVTRRTRAFRALLRSAERLTSLHELRREVSEDQLLDAQLLAMRRRERLLVARRRLERLLQLLGGLGGLELLTRRHGPRCAQIGSMLRLYLPLTLEGGPQVRTRLLARRRRLRLRLPAPFGKARELRLLLAEQLGHLLRRPARRHLFLDGAHELRPQRGEGQGLRGCAPRVARRRRRRGRQRCAVASDATERLRTGCLGLGARLCDLMREALSGTQWHSRGNQWGRGSAT